MARYGSGGEDFSAEAAELRAMREQREGMIAAERTYQNELAQTTGLQEESARAEATRRRAKTESREVSQRERVASQEATRAVNVDTEAIERNTQARRRSAAAARQQQINTSRAFAGARDPMFAQAYGIRGAETTQYAMRQQLEGVGSRRARAMQEAMQLGIRPAGAMEGIGAVTRAQAALTAKAAADLEAAQATKEYTNVQRRKSATVADVESALVAKESARARARAADVELESARTAETAGKANEQAIRTETRAREQVAQAKVEETRRTQATALGPVGGGRREPYGLLPAAGQTTQMAPTYSPAIGRRVPGPPRPDIREVGFGGTVGTPQGDVQYAQKQEQAAAAARATATEIRGQNEVLAANAMAAGRAGEAARIYSESLGDTARAAHALDQARADEFMERTAKSAHLMGRATRDAGINFYPLSQAMHRHGALTTEFIAAAARGETTIKEMGNQALLTAGKFAGWTLAATAVYGVAGALHQVATGALEAQSGAEQAFRVINETPGGRDRIQGQFGDLAQQFNVPMNEAADAVYRMGQVFHDQEDAVKAAEAALYSYKTGEVDVATSTKNLIAIVNGFGLSSDELVSIFDQINQAQNRFGIGIGDTEAGLAKAAGTYKNAGGDLDYLLGLFVAIQKATGRSGTEIGTGIARAVQRIREPISIEKLQAQGIEVDPQDFQKTLQNALKRAKTGQVDIQEVATGLFGNQYARLIAPVLADQTLLNKALSETSPEASKGSAQKELAKVLRESNEQIQLIGTNLQVMGEELSRAGAFNFVYVGLRAFNELLDVTTRVLDVFNALPAPLRQAITMFGQLVAAVTVLRKLGATERLAGTPFGFLAAPRQRERTHALAGLREAQAGARNIAERAGLAARGAAFEVDERREAIERHRPLAARGARLAVDDPEAIRIRQRTIQLESSLLQSEAALEDAVIRRTAAEKVVTVTTEDLAAVQKASAVETRAVLAQRGIAYPARLDQPNTEGVIVPGAAAAEEAGAVAAGGTAQQISRKRRQQAQILGRQSTEVMSNLRFSMLAATGGRDLGRSYDRLERVGNTAVRGLQAGGARALAAARSLRQVPTSIGGLVRGMGALDFALIGFIALEGLNSVVNSFNKDLDKTDQFLASYKGTSLKQQADLEAHVQSIKDSMGSLGGGATIGDNLQAINDILNPVELFGSTLPEMVKGEYDDPKTRRARQLQEAEQFAAELRSRRRMQAAQQGAGVARQQLTADELIGDENRDFADLQAGLISRQEFRRRLALHQEELKTLLGNEAQKQRAKLRTVGLARAGGTQEDFRAAVAGLSPQELDQETQAIVASASFTGRIADGIDRLGIAYAEAVQSLSGESDAASVLALAQARDAYYKGIEQIVNDELQAGLNLAGGDEGERQAAFRRAAGRLRNRITGPGSVARGRLEESSSNLIGARRRRAFLRDQLNNLLPNADVNPLTGEDQFGGLPDTSREQQLRKELQQADKDVKRFRRDRERFRAEFKEAKKRQADLMRELVDRPAYEDREAGRNIQLQLRLSTTASGSEQAALQIRFAQTQVRDAADTFGKNSREYRQALTNLNNARADDVQSMLADVNAENALMLARAGSDPGARARAEVQAATNNLNVLLRAQAQGKRVDPNEIKEAQARVIEADNQRQEQQKQDADQLANIQTQIAQARAHGDPVRIARIAVRAANRARATAHTPIERAQALLDWINANNDLEEALSQREEARTDLLTSRTEDPVKIARIEKDAARKAIKGTHGVERMHRIADYNRKKTAYRNSQIDAKQDDIDFLLEMDKISNEEAAKRLEQLAKTKGISKQKKRELLLAAKRLRDEAEGDYDIDIGSIKLPTLYEIRRFVQGGMPVGPDGGAQVNNNQSINITVNSEGDMQRVVKVLEDNLNGNAKSVARNVGLR